jgi:hypothetical protein
MTELLKASDERFLRYWAANTSMALDQSGEADWYGFAYSPDEKARMRVIAAALPGKAFGVFVAVTVTGFLVVAAVAVTAIMVPLLIWLYPDPAQTSAVVFVSTMAAICFGCIGFGLPVVMAWGARAGDLWGGGLPQVPIQGDAALIGKVRHQLWRMTLIMVGIFVPGCLIFILFNIDAGPLVFWLKLICAAVFAASVFRTATGRRSG